MMNNFKFLYNEKWKSDLQKVYRQRIIFPTTNIHNQKKGYMHNKLFKTRGTFFPLKAHTKLKSYKPTIFYYSCSEISL